MSTSLQGPGPSLGRAVIGAIGVYAQERRPEDESGFPRNVFPFTFLGFPY